MNLASGHWQPRSPCKKKRGATLYSDNVGQAKKGIFVGLMTQLPVIWIVDSEAVVAELVDAHVSGTCGFMLWEFKSPRPHLETDLFL